VGTDPSADPGAKTEGRAENHLACSARSSLPFGIGIKAINPIPHPSCCAELRGEPQSAVVVWRSGSLGPAKLAPSVAAADKSAALLGEILPVMIEILLTKGIEHDWGEVCFPPAN
jgi:hypothetical protein